MAQPVVSYSIMNGDNPRREHSLSAEGFAEINSGTAVTPHSSFQEMSTITTVIKMTELTVTWGPVVYLQVAPWCKASITQFHLSNRRKEWKGKN